MDLSKYPIDGPFPELTESNGGTSRRYAIAELAKRENLTIRQTYLRMLPSFGHIVMKGDGKQVADQIEDWYTSKACDGFNIHVGMQPGGLTSFVDHARLIALIVRLMMSAWHAFGAHQQTRHRSCFRASAASR